MLLGADAIGQTPIGGLLAATAATSTVSLANDPRYTARWHHNVRIKWGNDPEPAPAVDPQPQAVVPKVGVSPGIGNFDRLAETPEVEPIRIEAPDIAADVIRESAEAIQTRDEAIRAARQARRLREHQEAAARRAARLKLIEDEEQRAREIAAAARAAAEAERARLAAEAAERERIRLELVGKLQFDPQQSAARLDKQLGEVSHHMEAARAMLALQIEQIRNELAVSRNELAQLRAEAAHARDELKRVQNNLIAVQAASELLFSGD
jgi:hypothetical protein